MGGDDGARPLAVADVVGGRTARRATGRQQGRAERDEESEEGDDVGRPHDLTGAQVRGRPGTAVAQREADQRERQHDRDGDQHQERGPPDRAARRAHAERPPVAHQVRGAREGQQPEQRAGVGRDVQRRGDQQRRDRAPQRDRVAVAQPARRAQQQDRDDDGAFCALDQGLRHPETYSGIVAIAPYLDPGSGGEAMLATDAERAAHDVHAYASSLPSADQAVALMLVDDDDGTVREHLEQTAGDLRAVGRSVLLHQVDAGHTWAGAREAFAPALVYVAEQLGLTPVASTS